MEKIKLIAMCIGFFIVGCIFLVGLCVILGGMNGGAGTKRKKKLSLKSDTDTPKKKRYVTFTKRFFKIILINANIWVYLSFILAFMGKQEIAESISVQAIITIIGVFASYCIKSAYEKKIGKEKEEYEDFNAETYE